MDCFFGDLNGQNLYDGYEQWMDSEPDDFYRKSPKDVKKLAIIKKETEKAWLVLFRNSKETRWLPKSKCSFKESILKEEEWKMFTIPRWIYESEN